jgi:4-nitrophenyl phosphatase
MTDMLPPHVKALILDMDGVLWKDTSPIGDLSGIFNHINDLGLRVALATNNSSRTVTQYIERLRGFGVTVEPEQIVTSSLALADLLSKRYPRGTGIYVIGEVGMHEALTEKGYSVLPDDVGLEAKVVAMGMDRKITFDKLKIATLLIRRGIPFFGTNPDRTFPTPEGLIPGAGALLASVVTATDVQPTVVGKPEPYMMEFSLERLGTRREETLVVGDRLETDIAGGQAVGCPTALVLTGVTTRAMGEAWEPKVDIIAPDLTSLIGA